MAKLIFILIMAAAYVVGLHQFSGKALEAERELAQFYTTADSPDGLAAILSK